MSWSRVFVARLSGVGVFDPSGDQLGRFRDAVTTLRVGRPPRVVGVVVEMQHRHRIFVPMGRLTSLEPDAIVLSSGTVNMKRFERRTHELLVLAELLDRSVTVRDSGETATVVDVGMEQNRVRDWEITRLAVRAGGRLPRRRGQLSQVAWNEVTGIGLTEPAQGTDALVSMLSDLRPADVASALQDMPDKRRLEIANALDDERLADVLQELPEDDQVSLLQSLEDERAADILEA
ncbi:MAG: magnesium transporter, partial [Jatrophihabitans sp.]